MVNLTIRLSRGSTAGASPSGGGIPSSASASSGPGAAASGGAGGGAGLGAGLGDGSALPGPASSSIDGFFGSLPDQSVTVSCPDHLVLSDLPVAKGVGSIPDVILVKVLGRKARRRLGDKVHFCVRCDFPIAIYGRLDPCEHIFCLTCARRDSTCYLCGERVLRIQRMEVLDGIFICGAPRCLKSFIKRQDFQLHVRETHRDLIELAEDKERNHANAAFDSQKGQSSETQTQISGSPAIAQSLTVLEQRAGQSKPQQAPDTQSSRTIPGLATLDEKQLSKPEIEHKNHLLDHHHNSSFNNTDNRHTRQHRHTEENHFEEQAQPDPQQQPQPQLQQQQQQQQQQQPQQQQQQMLQPPLHQPQMQQGMMMMMMPGAQPGMIPMFPPQQYPISPYPMQQQQQQQEGHGMQPMLPPYQMAPPLPGGHLLPSPPLPQAPRPPPPLAPPPPLMPPPPPKRGKFEQASMPPTDPQIMDPQQGFMWRGSNPGYDNTNRSFGAWPPPPT